MVKHIKDIIGSPVAISPDKAGLLYIDLLASIEAGEKVVYSFDGVSLCSTAFCNASIGKLYMKVNPEKVSELISFVISNDEDKIWLEKVQKAKKLGEENYRDFRQQALEAIML